MAKKETLQLDVKVKGDDDVNDLAESLEDVEDASKKAQRTLDDMLTGFRSEIASTESAVKALGDAFGKGFDPATGEAVRGDVRGMDVPFQDIIADADKFAAQMKEMDAVHLDAVNKGITSVSTGSRQGRRRRPTSRAASWPTSPATPSATWATWPAPPAPSTS